MKVFTVNKIVLNKYLQTDKDIHSTIILSM